MRLRSMLLVVAVFVLGAPCFAQSITVRLLNQQGDKPIPNTKVKVYLYDRLPQGFDAWDVPTLTLKTDAKGEAHFSVPNPATFYTVVSVGLPHSQWECSCFVILRTVDVVNIGKVASSSPSAGTRPVPVSGEILIRATPLTFWQRLFHPILD